MRILKSALVAHGLMFLGMLVRPDADGWFTVGWMWASALVVLGVALPGRGTDG